MRLSVTKAMGEGGESPPPPELPSEPRGAIIIPTGDLSRYTQFTVSMMALEKPPGTIGLLEAGISVAKNLNSMVRIALRYPTVEWIWMIGDDHEFPPDIIYRLLEHNVDIVSPLCTYRRPPFNPVLFGKEKSKGTWFTINWDDLKGFKGIVEAPATLGGAGVLIKRRVFEYIPDPWFEIGQVKDTDALGDDTFFFDKCHKANIKLHVDLDLPIGHLTPVAIWPDHREDGSWGAKLNFSGDTWIPIPPTST